MTLEIIATENSSGQLQRLIPEVMVDAALSRTFIAGDTINPGAPVTKHNPNGLLYMAGSISPPGVVAFVGFSGETETREAGESVITVGSGIIRRDDWTPIAGTALLVQNAPYFINQLTPGTITTIPPVSPPVTVISRVGRAISPNHLVIASFPFILLRIAPTTGIPVWFDPMIGSFNPVSSLIVPPLSTALTITSGAITITRGWHSLLAVGTAAQRSLATINGGSPGQILILQKDAASVDNPIIDDVAGNIQSAGNFTLSSEKDKIGFIFDGTHWCELFRSNNA